MKVLSNILFKAGVIKDTVTGYSSGGYDVLVRNQATGNTEAISPSSFTPDMAAFMTLATAQTISGVKTFTSAVTASSFVKSGGTSSQFLKADGTIDSSTYLTSVGVSNLTATGTPSSTTYLRGDNTWATVVGGVTSVNTLTGAVTLTTTNIGEGTNLYYTDARSRAAYSLTTTGGSGASTYNSTTGVLNIPTYTLSGLGGQAALSGTGFVKSTAGVISYDTSTYYLSSNPSGYTTNTGTVTSVGGTGTVSGLTLTGTITSTGSLTLGGTLSLTSANVTGALGFTPYNATNPSGYITSSASISGSAASATSAGYLTGPAATNGTDGWFRSTGATGWYNTTYTGGIYCTDTSYVRTYNSFAFYVGNAILATGDITAYYSDERLKEKKGYITNAMDKLMSLDTFYYVNNELAQENGYTDTKMQVGFSAQQVKKVLPEIIKRAPFDMAVAEDGSEYSKSGEEYMTLDYGKLSPLIVAGMKEQQIQIEEQATEIKELKAIINASITNNGFTKH